MSTSLTYWSAFNSFATDWRRLVVDHRRIVSLGEDVFIQELRTILNEEISAQTEYPDFQRRPDVAERDFVESEINAYISERAIKHSPITDNLSLVMGHAVFERLVLDLVNVAIDDIPDTSVVDLYLYDKQQSSIRLQDYIENLHSVLRKNLKRSYCGNGCNLKDRVNFLARVAEKTNPEEFRILAKLYKLNSLIRGVRDIDKKRQLVIHQLEITSDYDAENDLDTLILTARFLVHSIANSIYSRGFCYISGFADCFSEHPTLRKLSLTHDYDCELIDNARPWNKKKHVAAAWERCLSNVNRA